MKNYPTESITVSGGELHYRIWGESGPWIFASHGITASHVSFNTLARVFGDDYRILAPDHRGRGRSRNISGPWGMEEHARDSIALLDALNIDKVDVFLGHSMGGFIAATAGAMAPERVPNLLLVDGGLPLVNELPEGMTAETLVQAVIGPAMERLDMQFESEQAYIDYWRPHPALADDWSSDFEDYILYDLTGNAPQLHPSTKKEAVIGDVETQLIGPTIPDALRNLQQRVRLVTAERGIMNDASLYRQDQVDPWQALIPNFSRGHVDGVNHYTIVASERGAQALKAEVVSLLA